MRSKTFVLLFLCAATAATAATAAKASADYALRGTLVTPDEVIENGYLLVSNGRIAAAGAGVAIPQDVPIIDTEGFIYPGLIDLHDHVTWNAFGRWSLPQPVRNRYDWQAMESYARALSGPHGAVQQTNACDLERFGEVKALLWGGTSLVGSLLNPCSRGLARNLDYASGFAGDAAGKERLQYRIFPFELAPGEENSVRKALSAGIPVIVHLAEGVDASAAREVRMARAHGYLTKGLVIIHGIPLTEEDFKDAAAAAVGLVWSPRSNVELYGRTADVAAARRANVLMAISPDWSPSGSSGMIPELRYAADWNDQQSPRVFTARDLVQMATANPARLAKVDDKVGRLAPGLYADYVVIRGGNDGSRARGPYESLLYADVADVLLVAVNGRPLAGAAKLMAAVNPAAHLELVTVCGVEKALDMSDSDGGDGGAGISFAQTVSALETAMHALQPPVPLAGLAECP